MYRLCNYSSNEWNLVIYSRHYIVDGIKIWLFSFFILEELFQRSKLVELFFFFETKNYVLKKYMYKGCTRFFPLSSLIKKKGKRKMTIELSEENLKTRLQIQFQIFIVLHY